MNLKYHLKRDEKQEDAEGLFKPRIGHGLNIVGANQAAYKEPQADPAGYIQCAEPSDREIVMTLKTCQSWTFRAKKYNHFTVAPQCNF